ncbi:MAG: glycosyltransferase [Actinobacteria bacterium]|jgi:hypothetical protein|nr:glycosyltransferase [Actinomycetota bacterium]
MRVPDPSFDHLAALSTADGLFEHAVFNHPRREHGYCVDDVARGLVVTSRQPDPTDDVVALSRVYAEFVVRAIDRRGWVHNRRGETGPWTDAASLGDHWGRAVWGLGTAAAWSVDEHVRKRSLAAAGVCLRARSPWPRAMAYAAVGAFEVLRSEPGHAGALRLMTDARTMLGHSTPDEAWPWPESRLTYANAVVPEALIVIGTALDDDATLQKGLSLLTWLVEQETRGTHLSVTPAGGWVTGEARPAFDQQPIEVAALAEACFRAWDLTREPSWAFVMDRCVAWFLGWNDSGLALFDPTTGGGYDGLLADCVNLNEGAESTLAAISTFQLAKLAAPAPVPA